MLIVLHRLRDGILLEMLCLGPRHVDLFDLCHFARFDSVDDLSTKLSSSLHSQIIKIVNSQFDIPRHVASILAVDFVARGYAIKPPPYPDILPSMYAYAQQFSNISVIAAITKDAYLYELRKEFPSGPTDLIDIAQFPDYNRTHYRLHVHENGSAPYFSSSYVRTLAKQTFSPNESWWEGDEMPDKGSWVLFTFPHNTVNISFGKKMMYNGTFVGVVYIDYMLSVLITLLKEIQVAKGVTIAIIDHEDRLIASNSQAAIDVTEEALRPAAESKDPVLADGAKFIIAQRNANKTLVKDMQYTLSAGGQSYILSVIPMVFNSHKNQSWTICLMLPRAVFFGASDAGMMYSIVSVVIVFLASLVISMALVFTVSRHIQRIVSQVDGVVSYRDNAFSTSARGNSPRWFRVSEVQTLQESVTRMKMILQSFEKYIPVQLLKYLVQQNQPATLGLDRSTASVMFLDVAGFTSIMERIPLQELIDQFTEYCNEAISTIVANHGTLDKMMGDGMMAFFGCPPTTLRDHQYWASRCALHLQRMMVRFRAKWAREGRVPLHIRIGVASGPVSVGNVGSASRFQYTVLGDVVNLAARMESLNKCFGTYTLITGHTAEPLQTPDRSFITRRLCTVRVKGRSARTRIYELISAPELFDVELPTVQPLTPEQTMQCTQRTDMLDEAPSERPSGVMSLGGSVRGSVRGLESGMPQTPRTPVSELFLSVRSAVQEVEMPKGVEIEIPARIRDLPPPVHRLYQAAQLFSEATSHYESQQFRQALECYQTYLRLPTQALRHDTVLLEQECYAQQLGCGEDSWASQVQEQYEAEVYAREMIERCSLYLREPPAKNWDPVITMTEK